MVSELTATDNDGPIVTVEIADPEQPFEVPVTVYDVVEVGETVIEAVVSPELQE
jgi:hypothetical protein